MFTKLFSSITDSTIWREPDHVRLVWITMLAKCDKNGIVYASIPGLSDAARVPLDLCQAALKILSSPDEWSRSREEDGRRIIEIEGGWLLVNHQKYKRIKDADERREYIRLKVKEFREKNDSVNNVNNVNSGKQGKHIRSDQIRSDKNTNDDFLDFWKSYPRKDGKIAAQRIWERLKLTEAEKSKIREALNFQKKTPQWQKNNGEFIPHAKTWLNQRRWEDESASEKIPSKKVPSSEEFFNHQMKNQ